MPNGCASGVECESGGTAPLALYEVSNFATFPNEKRRWRICSGCAAGHQRRGYTVEKVDGTERPIR